MAQRYRLTARRRAALKKAQLASARKRARNKKIKRAAVIGGGAAAVVGVGVARHKLSGSKITYSTERISVPGQRVKVSTISGVKVRNIVNSPGSNRFLGRPGLIANRTKGGAQIGYKYRPKKPKSVLSSEVGKDRTIIYHHQRLNTKVASRQVARQAATVLGKPLTQSTRNRLAYATRGIRGKGNPYAPQYDPKSLLNYGSYGKRLPRVDRFIKTRGGKEVL